MGPSVTTKPNKYRDNEKRNNVCVLNLRYIGAQKRHSFGHTPRQDTVVLVVIPKPLNQRNTNQSTPNNICRKENNTDNCISALE